MAGIGLKLNRLFETNTISTNIIGYAYSTLSTLTPMLVVILDVILMEYFLRFDTLGFAQRELFSCTVLYVFIFSLLTTAPFNSVLSKYVSDVIYEDRYEDILPCFYLGLFMNVLLSSAVGIPFCWHEYFVGHVDIFYVFMGYCCYIGLVLVFYAMIYLSITKDYQKISMFFTIGMLVSFILSLALHYLAGWGISESMLFSMMTGFFVIAVLEIAVIKRYFVKNSNRYRPVLRYFRLYWPLIFANFLYFLGLYISNFVFWTTDMQLIVVDSFVCNQPYDMATCIAMFTNISGTVIFIARVEMQFHDRYKAYSESIIGGRGADIDTAQKEMFRSLSSELMSLVRIQFIITVVVSLIAFIVLPLWGITSLTMRIYPCLDVAFFIVFIMYAEIVFLYYYNDLSGAFLTSLTFCLVSFIGSIFATHLSELWYGIGFVVGAFAGWSVAYFRLRHIEKTLNAHIFCSGILLRTGIGPKPEAKVYEKGSLPVQANSNQT
ncbi:MAG: exopolysaccharide Pel transporter PelG [Clostridia bacterium]|nr:exopolysaccharide Pel transporter PelG [Clostridia bacterium]